MLAVALTGAVSASASAYSWQHHGYVYVNDNTAGVNRIAGFSRNADGTLIPLPGSPFAAGGAGAGAVTPSQGALQEADYGHYLLAVDAGSNQISVLRVEQDGSLALVDVASSNGVDPVSIAVHDNLVYVANGGAGGTNYTGFVLGWDGRLWALPGSTVTLPAGSEPGDILFNSTGTRLVGTRVATSLIDSFTVGWNGRLTAAAGSPYAAQGPGPFGSAFRPTNPSQLFVSNAHGGAGNGTVSAFEDGWGASLTPIGSSPFADLQTAPCWVTISPDGRYLFAVNTAVPSISSYQIAWNGALTLLGSTSYTETGPVGPFDAAVSPDGQTLYTVDAAAGALSAFSVAGGSLTELASSPIALPAGATPFGIVVSQS
jgi:DNA-binding beta-propeller fold protein YncE